MRYQWKGGDEDGECKVSVVWIGRRCSYGKKTAEKKALSTLSITSSSRFLLIGNITAVEVASLKKNQLSKTEVNILKLNSKVQLMNKLESNAKICIISILLFES